MRLLVLLSTMAWTVPARSKNTLMEVVPEHGYVSPVRNVDMSMVRLIRDFGKYEDKRDSVIQEVDRTLRTRPTYSARNALRSEANDRDLNRDFVKSYTARYRGVLGDAMTSWSRAPPIKRSRRGSAREDLAVCRAVCNPCRRYLSLSVAALCWTDCVSSGTFFDACVTSISVYKPKAE